MKKIRAAIIGAGNRGVDAYAQYAEKFPHELEITSVAEPREERRKNFSSRFKLDESNVFSDWKELLDAPKKADLVFICTQDTMHVQPAIKAMEKGYHILLEKPIAVTREDTLLLLESSKKYDVSIAVAHVLRYTPFFSAMKRQLDSGVIGEIQGISHNENVGHIHYSHSFVRGNWRNRTESSPMILAKSCHDMDILLFLTGQNCKKISSFGSRRVFLPENRPAGAPDRCLDGCFHHAECPYYGPKVYLNGNTDWPVSVLTTDLTVSGISKALKEGPYGRCVYACDNDVVEQQVLNLVFDNGIPATFTMSAFTNETSRTIKIMGNKGEIRGNMEKGEIKIYDFETSEVSTVSLYASETGHGGGDDGIVRELILHLNDRTRPLTSSLEKSVQSHLMAFAAEEAMQTGKLIEL
ncbi:MULTISPECIES: Gfo/Idh/MocA family protein [unclassified Oceanispirochaeta]|uniref:Gfo/Idh/MocA family protein n=1 Tax=unclassified Oceanispirochaeta TaxID=2635722 RepID=UPI000E0965FD|nr:MULTISPECIES: Gfo/Idh/MocA family oxidoreductase [unclassified Oceanispirochaeta]MBF9015020.1 Gfo/Idh/MocA family oxidoreductase [Oceanispirochaeta sp. M2]NPD71478.1 Gfo/Idh/MocA family oxidoreductase [Oceanispirochaeta sp. M1]RDG33217.1 gfo/Idh/MocA family oxidoreductase [Oceanispirochaeta sp. M1]